MGHVSIPIQLLKWQRTGEKTKTFHYCLFYTCLKMHQIYFKSQSDLCMKRVMTTLMY